MLLRPTAIALCIHLTLAIVQAAGALELTDEERAFIAEHPTVVVGGEMDWPPLDFVENGQYKGAAKDYLDLVQDMTGLSFEIVTGLTWSQLLDGLRRKEIDMLPMIYWSEQRGRELNLTNPFITIRHYAFTKGRREGISSFADLAGKTAAIPAGYAHIGYLSTQHPQVQILQVSTVLDAMDAVITGRADVMIENTAAVAYHTQNESIIGLVPAFPIRFEINNVHMATRKDWPILRDIVQKALDQVSSEQATEILTRWTGSEAAAKTFIVAPVTLTPAEQAHLRDRTHISACINANRMPLEAFRNHTHEGITSDYLTLLSDTLKLPITAVARTSWRAAVESIAAGECDIVTLAIESPAHHADLTFSEPYLRERYALATRIGEAFYMDLGGLVGARIGVVEGSVDLAALRKRLPDVEFVVVTDLSDGLSQVADTRLFGLLDYVPTLSDRIRRSHEGTLKISGDFPQDAVGFSIATASNQPQLASAIAKVVRAVPNAQRQNIRNKWIAVSIEKQLDYRLLLQILVVVGVLSIAVFFRYRELREHRVQMQQKNAELEDINARLEQQSEAAMHMAYHDQLTGLANRAKLLLDLEHAIQLGKRTGSKVAVLFLDLDRFKYVNDSLGHDVGDKLLQAVAERIADLLRDTDTLCRIGGDEFIVILEAISNAYSPSIVAQRIIDALCSDFQIGPHKVSIGTSIGIATCPDDTDELNALLKYADSAMYRAKENGRNAFHFYHEELSRYATRRMAIQTSLRQPLDELEFSVVFQPIVDLRRRRVVKAEALVRWNHPQLGNIAPNEFIPIAEDLGVIAPLGEWVLARTCEALKQFAGQGCELTALSMNVSSIEFQKSGVAGRFEKVISQLGVRPDQIEFEITERCLLDQEPDNAKDLQALNAAGHRICIDDFGTGYSALSYIKRLPLHTIKIDRSFMSNTPLDEDDSAMARAIISLCQNLGYKVVAEGVESAMQLDFLLERCCDYAQGYYFSEPVPAADFAACVSRVNRRLANFAGTLDQGAASLETTPNRHDRSAAG